MSDEKTVKKKEKTISVVGKRKSAIARANARRGTGRITINGRPMEMFGTEMERMMISEPLALAGELAGQIDMDIVVRSGGEMGQADAIRQAIAKSFVGFDKKLKGKFISYDRALLVADVRRNEPHKPSRSKQGPRRHKQRSKR